MPLIRFADIVGHDKLRQSLQRAIAAGRQHHALLFRGPEGVGKRTLALAYANTLLCERAQAMAEPDACGECTACIKLTAGEHPDRMLVEPDGRFLKIGQIREIIRATHFRPFEARLRIVTIEQPEAMRDPAANALLKTLEEPGGETFFVVVSAQAHRLLPTIRSRCQPMHFAPLNDDAIRTLLERNGHVGTDAAIALAGGSISRALHVIDSPLLEQREHLVKAVVALRRAPFSVCTQLAEDCRGTVREVAEMLDILLLFLRDVVVARTTGSMNHVRNRDLTDEIRSFGEGRSPQTLLGFVDAVSDTRSLVEGMVNQRLALETLFTRLTV